MQRTNIYLEERQTAALDRLAAVEGVSRAEVIRRLLDRVLLGADDVSADLARLEASFGGADDIVPPDRSPGERERLLAQAWAVSA